MINWQDLTAQEKVKRAKIQMYKKNPFFSYILIYMKDRQMEPEMVKHMKEINGEATMAVDPDGNLYYGEEWVHTLAEDELMGVIAHEVMHIALMHLIRVKGRHPQVWNISTDLVSNAILQQANFTLPKVGLIPDRYNSSYKLDGHEIKDLNKRSAEEVYDEVYPLIPKKDGHGDWYRPGGKGEGGKKDRKLTDEQIKKLKESMKGFDGHLQGKGNKPGQDDNKNGKGKGGLRPDKEQEWKKIVAEAASLAKQQGQLPAGLERMIEGLLDAKVDWRTKLYKYVIAQLPFDYDWNYPSKRSSALGIHLPRILKESVQIIFHIDTSGSMSNIEMADALGELQSIIQSFNNVKVDVLVGDAEMQNTFTLTAENKEDILDFAKELKGGGGTDHRYVFKYIDDNINDARVLICFTDGYSSFPKDENYPFDTIWLLTEHSCNEKDIPFGEVIKMKNE